MAAHEAPLSLGFSRQEHWSGLPFPSPMQVKSESEVAQSYPTFSDPMDCSLPGSSVHGIFQARVLEWVAICWQFWAKIREKRSKNKSISMNTGFVAFYHHTEVLMAFALNLRIDHFSWVFIFAFCMFVKFTHSGTLSKSWAHVGQCP